jgi:hypothetical protein
VEAGVDCEPSRAVLSFHERDGRLIKQLSLNLGEEDPRVSGRIIALAVADELERMQLVPRPAPAASPKPAPKRPEPRVRAHVLTLGSGLELRFSPTQPAFVAHGGYTHQAAVLGLETGVQFELGEVTTRSGEVRRRATSVHLGLRFAPRSASFRPALAAGLRAGHAWLDGVASEFVDARGNGVRGVHGGVYVAPRLGFRLSPSWEIAARSELGLSVLATQGRDLDGRSHGYRGPWLGTTLELGVAW